MGEVAALLTSICWTFSAIFFSRAGQEVGSLVVNRVRLFFAVILLMISHIILTGQVLPLGAEPERWMWLGLSGFIGLVLGDICLFQAYVMVGARLSTLIMASAPVLGTLLAWIFLGETLEGFKIAGIFLTVAGISFVVLEHSNGSFAIGNDRRRYVLGVLCSVGGAVGQAVGLILAKKGLMGDFPAISGVVIRMFVAAIAMWSLTLVQRQARDTVRKITQNRLALRYTMQGAFAGPFIGVWLSLVAVQMTYVGIASTLMALSPIFLLAISRFYFKEQVSTRAVIGTVITLVGVTAISLF